MVKQIFQGGAGLLYELLDTARWGAPPLQPTVDPP
jgi:hypothetical protein